MACVRDHRWPWLRDEAGEPVAVDGWWPDLGVALLLHDGALTRELRAILRMIDAHGMESLAFSLPTLRSEGALTPRRRAEYTRQFALLLTDPARRLEARVDLGLVSHTDLGVFDDFVGFDEAADDEDDDWADDDRAFEEWSAAPRPQLGWRTRPVLLALLAAGALGRRSTSVDFAGPFEPLEIQVLGALALTALDPPAPEAGITRDGVAALLAADDRDLHHTLESLAGRGLAAPAVEDPLDAGGAVSWAVTEAGNAAVETWIARCLTLFAGWPPDHPEADDAA